MKRTHCEIVDLTAEIDAEVVRPAKLVKAEEFPPYTPEDTAEVVSNEAKITDDSTVEFKEEVPRSPKIASLYRGKRSLTSRLASFMERAAVEDEEEDEEVDHQEEVKNNEEVDDMPGKRDPVRWAHIPWIDDYEAAYRELIPELQEMPGFRHIAKGQIDATFRDAFPKSEDRWRAASRAYNELSTLQYFRNKYGQKYDTD
jgi:hypothetical protein